MTTRSILILIPLLLLSACTDSPTWTQMGNSFAPADPKTQLAPLAVGNGWRYRNMLTDTPGVPEGTFFIDTITRAEFYSLVTLNPATGERGGISLGDCKFLGYISFIHGKRAWVQMMDGIGFGEASDVTRTTVMTRSLPTYPIVGRTYSYDRGLVHIGKETVTVPAGTFDCYKFTYQGERNTYWWARGVGLVQQKSIGEGGDPVAHWGLESYTIRD